ncbi:MAG: hypothetical protein OXG35_33920 [Acidobacteria bacterium]|nr:hypothetical protein [Acidobacteriota bacterium]
MTMLDNDDRNVLRFLQKKWMTKDPEYGPTPNRLACGVTCLTVSGHAAASHLVYAAWTAVIWRTHDGAPVVATVARHLRKSMLHAGLAAAGLAVTATVGPFWCLMYVLFRLMPPRRRSPDDPTGK